MVDRMNAWFKPLSKSGVAVICCLTMLAVSLPLPATTFALVVSGLPGTEEYAESFTDWSGAYVQALRSLDTDDSLVVSLDSAATREQILEAISQQAAAIAQIASETDNDQTLTFVLILVGHGTADTANWRFNIKGPDLTTEDIVAAMNGVMSERQLIVLATSASGATLDALSQPGRVVVTATKSGGEVNAVRFPGFLADAMRNEVADYDRNEILTVAEAYRFAEGRTREYYEREKLLASEHSRLRGDDAASIAMALLGSLKDAKDDPVVAALLDQRLVLEKDFQLLKSKKSDMPVDDYYAELEQLLMSIATLQQSIDDATGWSENDADS